MFAERLLYNPHAPLRIHRVADAPSDNIPAEHLYDGGKVHEPLFHWYVGDVHLPHLVAVVYFQATEQVRELYLGIQALQLLVPGLFRHLLRENKGGFGKKLPLPCGNLLLRQLKFGRQFRQRLLTLNGFNGYTRFPETAHAQ